ncbi:MAG: hypothetical protein J0H64_00500, partial [Actinobacteria bacterium]|nr:hypothetical protein [Actinomycetota bacterium]
SAAPSPEATASATAAARSRVKLRITSRTKTDIERGTRFVFRGVASKALKGKTVRLQHRVGNSWRTVAKSTVRSSRTFTLSTTANTGGTQKYRVYVAKTKRTRSAVTPAYTYRIWSWQNLAPKGFAGWNVDMLDRTYYVGTTGFAHSIQQNLGTMPAGVKFRLNGQCSALAAWVGLSTVQDHSGTTRDFWMVTDGTTHSLGTQGLGLARKVTANLTGVDELRLGVSSTASPIYFGIYGSPQAHCLGELPTPPVTNPGGPE